MDIRTLILSYINLYAPDVVLGKLAYESVYIVWGISVYDVLCLTNKLLV